ncbi:MAG: hypothetical protein HYZ15_05175 [Sphingobacteriales bacterium]|nr:hypothetical protein [Sphingobacteriales bacterium]
MRLLILLGSIFLLSVSAENCNKKNKDKLFKGRLEVAGICMNYTIGILEGKMDTALFLPSWKDEVTGKTYTDVFKLGSPCNFPSTLKQGDTFYFTIDHEKEQPCAVCMAYYPAPSRSLRIKVVQP